MEVEKQFNLDSLGREDSQKARMEAQRHLEPFEEDVLPEMVNFYSGDDYEPAEKLVLDIVETVETHGIQFNGEAGGRYKGRNEEVMKIKLPYSTGLREPIHELAHDVIQNTVDFEEDDRVDQKENLDDNSVDELVEQTFEEAFCDFNSLFFGDIQGENFEDLIGSIGTPYRNQFEDTFETLWEGVNPEYVDTRRTALRNAKGSLEAIRDLEDEDTELISSLEDQFLSNIETYQTTPPVGDQANFFSGKIPFIVTQADQEYQVPVNEDEEYTEWEREQLESMNKTLSNYPEEPVADNIFSNSITLDMALSHADRLGAVDDIEKWGEFIYEHIKYSRGYSIGLDQDLDISHTVGARKAMEEYRESNLPSEMLEEPERYFEEIKQGVKNVLGTWMTYTGIQKDLETLEKGSKKRHRAVNEMETATAYQPDQNQQIVQKLYEKNPSELEPEDRHGLRYVVESLRMKHDGEWFTDPYREPF